MRKKAIIIGAGPAGLTAAYEFCKRGDIKPIVLEKSDYMGGLARTVNYQGNRIDLGGHRFFSKSDRVTEWWLEILPLEKVNGPQQISYQQQTRMVQATVGGMKSERRQDSSSVSRTGRGPRDAHPAAQISHLLSA